MHLLMDQIMILTLDEHSVPVDQFSFLWAFATCFYPFYNFNNFGLENSLYNIISKYREL